MIIVIDNYDSFTYNIVEYLRQLGKEMIVLKNDQCTIYDIKSLNPSGILLSPGPGNPNEAGICLEVLEAFCGKVPILGVCLGHQLIGQFFGGDVVKANSPMHGKVSEISHDGRTVYRGLPSRFFVARYHSLIVSRDTLPDCLEVSALSLDGEIMGIRHKTYQVEGVQFHPEAILTEYGLDMINNFFEETHIC